MPCELTWEPHLEVESTILGGPNPASQLAFESADLILVAAFDGFALKIKWSSYGMGMFLNHCLLVKYWRLVPAGHTLRDPAHRRDGPSCYQRLRAIPTPPLRHTSHICSLCYIKASERSSGWDVGVLSPAQRIKIKVTCYSRMLWNVDGSANSILSGT